MLVGHLAVENGVLEGRFQRTDFAARLEVEKTHDFVAVDGRLEVAYAVFLLNVHQFLAYDAEVLEKILLALLVLAGDVGLAQRHEVVDVVASLEEQTAHGTVGHDVVGNSDGPHVQAYEFGHVLHAFVEGQFETAEEWGNHFLAQVVVVVKRPAHGRLPALAAGLADVVQARQGGVHLDTMFIDEGFGTLDPEALNSAMNTLIDLQSTGRLVGIISHVPELEERIDARLKVSPAEKGSRAEFEIVE